MWAHIFITCLVLPPACFVILFLSICDQHSVTGEIIQTKGEAQQEVLKKLPKHPIFTLWISFLLFLIGIITGWLETILHAMT